MYWRVGVLSVDGNEDFEPINEDLKCGLQLSISETLILSTSDQRIASEISVDVQFAEITT